MRTPFSETNKQFTKKAHAASRSLIYPHVFAVRPSSIEWVIHDVSTGGVSAVLDGQLGIDITAKVSRPGCLACFETMIQERFRRIDFCHYRDITITEMNRNSGLPSELYKLKAGLFTYGYFDDATGQFGEVVVVNVETLVDAIACDKIKIKNRKLNPRTNQTFVTVDFDEMLQFPGMVRWHRPRYAVSTSNLLRSRPYWSGSSRKSQQVQARLLFPE